MYIIGWKEIKEKFPLAFDELNLQNWFDVSSEKHIFSSNSEADFIAFLLNRGFKVAMHRDICTSSFNGVFSDIIPLFDYLEDDLIARKTIEKLNVGNVVPQHSEIDNTEIPIPTNCIEFDIMTTTLNITDSSKLNDKEKEFIKSFFQNSFSFALKDENYEMAQHIHNQAKQYGITLK